LNIVADYGGGGMLLALGIMLALHERRSSGRGQVIDAAMVDGVSLLMTGIWSRAAQGRWPGEPGANELDSGAPFYDVYPTSDREYMAVGSIEPVFWARLLDGLGLDPAALPDQWDRERWQHSKQVIASAFATRTRAHWTGVFTGVDACVTPVLSMTEATDDPHLASRSTLLRGTDGPQPAPAPRLGRTPMRVPSHTSTAEDALHRWGVRRHDHLDSAGPMPRERS
jgi:alpha-methylacyl-CoA racemase